MNGLLQELLAAVVRGYRYVVSPLLPAACRFYPSCSAYALESLQMHGPWRGSWLSACRVCRCGPWHPGGVDPVPAQKEQVTTR